MGHRLKKSWKNLTDMVPLLKRKQIRQKLSHKKNSEEWEAITKKCFKDLIEMKKFELERKYLVLSVNDINTYLSEGERAYLNNIVEILYNARIEDCKDQLEGVFIKKSYPFYEDTLKKLEMYVKQQNRKEISMVSLGGQQMLLAEDINPSRVNRGVCIKITGREEFLSKADLEGFCTGLGSVFNGNRYHIQCFPIKGHAIMLQIRESHNGKTHFFHTTIPAIQAVIENLC